MEARPRNSREPTTTARKFFSLQIKTYYSLPQLQAREEREKKKEKIPSAIKNDFVAYVCVCVGRISLIR